MPKGPRITPKGPRTRQVRGPFGQPRGSRPAKVYAFVVSSTSSSGSRPGVFRSNFVIANRKIA